MRKSNAIPLSILCSVVIVLLMPPSLESQGARVRPGKQTSSSVQPNVPDEDLDPDADNPTGRQEWFRGGRRAAGEHASDLLHRAYIQKQQMTLNSQGSTQQSTSTFSAAPGQNTASGIPFTGATFPGTWTNLGPAPIGSDPGQDYGRVVGRVTSVVVDQGDNTGNTIYIGAAFGGVWKSTNAAAADPTTVKWTPLIDDQPTLAVGAVSIQPGMTGNSAVVLVGTGEPNSSGDSYYGMGILRSTDGGQTWAPIIKSADNGVKTFAGLGASKFAWSTASPNLVVVGMGSTNGKRYGSDSIGGRGIYYSQDAGQTWHYATVQDGTTTLTEGTVTDVSYNPGTGKFYAFYRYHGFYESADGAIWSRSTNQPSSSGALNTVNCPTSQPTPNPTGNCPLYRGQIAIQPTTRDMYVIYVNDNDISQGVFVLSNGSSTWRPLNSTGTTGLVDNTSTNQIGQGDYNLWIGAVPNGAGTDLMVGTRDIFKCSLNPSQGINDCTWINLTFVYNVNRGVNCPSNVPIAAASHVHPDQHGFDFALNSLKMYFVNDGGVYRALNGTSISDGACTSPNPFENLDANMGSLSEMVSFSQHPANQNVLLGGLQDNGTPALLGSATLLWQTVNGGDGGFNEIDPNNPDGIWYATNTGVSIQQCDATNKQAPPNGPNIANAEACTPGTFGAAPYPAAGPNVGPSQVANDTAEFYMPYTLDPSDGALGSSRDLLVGTCRLWRGPGVGGTSWFDVTTASTVPNKDVSPIFDSNATTCVNGTTKIRAIAAGGPQVSVSQKDGGTTGSPTVVTHTVSQVLYVGLEGAGTLNDSGGNLGHVFVNTNAGALQHGSTAGWVDVTPNPGAVLNTGSATYGPYPVSSIEVDRSDATGKTAYLTVEGFGVSHIFRTISAGSSWTDVTSNLPDAPLDSIAVDPDDPNVLYVGTDIGAFISLNAGASWEILGTGLPNVPVTKIRVFGSNAVQPKLLRVSTYGRGVWQFALPLPPAVDLSPNPVAFGNRLVKSTASQTVTFTNNSGSPVTIASVALGTPAGTDFAITNNCPIGTLANLAACQVQVSFSPQTAISESNTLVITDSAAGSPHTTAISGTGVVSALSLSTSSLTFNGSVQNATSAQTVTVSNSGSTSTTISGISITAPFAKSGGTCSAGISLPANGGNCTIPIVFTATAAGQTNGTLTITDANGISQSANLVGNASDFAIGAGASGTSQTVNSGQPATYNLNASAVDGFNSTVAFACTSGVPAAATCTFAPSASVSVSGTTPTAVTLTISTTAHSSSQPAPTSGSVSSPFSRNGPAAALIISLGALLTLLLACSKQGRSRTRSLALLGVVAGVSLIPACGGSNSITPPPITGTPAGTYSLVVTATSGSRSIPTTLTLKVN